jgi:hypothetical protein
LADDHLAWARASNVPLPRKIQAIIGGSSSMRGPSCVIAALQGLREVLKKEEVSFQAIKTWEQSTDPDYEAKKNRVLELYDIAEGKAGPGPGDPTVVFSMDEFGPLNLLPRPGKQWAPVVRRSEKGSTSSPRRRRRRRPATYKRTQGGAPPARRARHERRQALRAREGQQEAHHIP